MNLLSVIVASCMILMLIDGSHEIINGIPAAIGSFKYQVALKITKKKFCGGTILDEDHILTAAHCVYGFDQSKMRVSAGSTIRNSVEGIIRTVEDIYIHSNYDPVTFATDDDLLSPILNDIAVLTLSHPLELGDAVQKIDLPSGNISYCNLCNIAGWGRTEYGGTTNLLRFAQLVITPPTECEKMNSPLRHREFCAYDPWYTSVPSKGDSGGGLVCDGNVVGVVSYGLSEPEKPAIFVNVYDHLDFIRQSMND